MFGESLMEANGIEDARYVSFDAKLNGITRNKLYQVKSGSPIGIDRGVGRLFSTECIYPNEYYIINDNGSRMTDIWAWFETSYYK